MDIGSADTILSYIVRKYVIIVHSDAVIICYVRLLR